jgi:LPXTG-site transpeptidase (sortase) family protein
VLATALDDAVAVLRRPLRPRARPVIGIPDSCRVFVEQIVANAIAEAARDHPEYEAVSVDWASIWGAGRGAPSTEVAVGRIVAAALVVSREITRGRDLFGVPEQTTGPPEVETSPELTWLSTVVADPSPIHSVATAIAVPRPVPLQPEAQPQSAVALFDETIGAPPNRTMVASASGWSTFFTWLRNVGIVVILFVGWQLWGTSISQHHAQHQLQSSFEAAVHAHHNPSTTGTAPALISAEASVPTPAEGSSVAHLQIPSIDLDEYVVSGTAEGDLAKGPGHYIGSAAPGQAGNVAIAGHRTTNGAPFNRIGQLAIGDQIYLTTTTGERLTYVVSQPPVAVSPSDVSVLDNFGDDRVTLTTCNPEFSSSQRLIVVGELKGPTPPVATKVKPGAYHLVDAQTASWAWGLLPVVVLEAGVLLLLGLSNRRFASWYGGIGRWFILVPIWAAGLYALFGTLTTFLPATF